MVAQASGRLRRAFVRGAPGQVKAEFNGQPQRARWIQRLATVIQGLLLRVALRFAFGRSIGGSPA
jgi:hypothetical protein